MEIDRQVILDRLLADGEIDRAGFAAKTLPAVIDTDKDANQLTMFGINPLELLKPERTKDQHEIFEASATPRAGKRADSVAASKAISPESPAVKRNPPIHEGNPT
jgi:hypothetical protein